MQIVKQFLLDESGQDLVEYSLLIVFVLIASTIVLQETGSSVVPVWKTGKSIVEDAAVRAS